MEPITATILGGALGGVASGIGGYLGGTKSADVSAAAAARNTEKQIAWERERATSAHQWEVEDLKKAGLNPILSAGGSGAVTGGINPQLPDTTGINSAYSALGNIGMNIIDIVTNAAEKQASAQQAMSNAKLLDKKRFTEDSLQTLYKYQKGLINKQTAVEELKRQQEEINADWKETEKWIDNTMKVAGPILKVLEMYGIAGLIKGKGKKGTNVIINNGPKETQKKLGLYDKSGNWIDLKVPKVH